MHVNGSGDYEVTSGNGRIIGAVQFHEGEVGPDGPDGMTVETLLSIALDRLIEWQHSPSRCSENTIAINGIQSALEILDMRTRRVEKAKAEATTRPSFAPESLDRCNGGPCRNARDEAAIAASRSIAEAFDNFIRTVERSFQTI